MTILEAVSLLFQNPGATTILFALGLIDGFLFIRFTKRDPHVLLFVTGFFVCVLGIPLVASYVAITLTSGTLFPTASAFIGAQLISILIGIYAGL